MRLLIGRFKAKTNLVVGKTLVLKDDELFVQSPDGKVNHQCLIFNPDRTLMGSVDSDGYWDLRKYLEGVKND